MAFKGTKGITNLFLLNKYLQGVQDAPSTEDVDTIRYLIEDTISLIQDSCGRVFETDTYKEWIDTNGESYAIVKNYPITNIKLLSTSGIDLMNIENTGNPLATTSSNNASLTLTSIATTGTETNTVLDYSTYANVSSLVTAVDIIDGWDAETLGSQGDALTSLIRPLDSGYAVDTKVCLRGPYLGSSARVSYDSNIVDFGGSGFSGSGFGWSPYDSYMNSSVFIWYTGGYVVPECSDSGGEETVAGNVPGGLTLITNKIILDILRERDEDMNMDSEKIGDYSFKRALISSVINRHWHELSIYARKSY